MNTLFYYSRPEIQKAILETSHNKEASVMLGIGMFGRRPEILNYESDIMELVKQGATSFHISEEHWKNPQHLSTGMNKKQLDDLRQGWDFIIDIDSPQLKHSKIIAYFLIEALKFHNIKNISIKFSGNKGFHIGIPFEAFPDKIKEREVKDLFPEAPRIMAEYLTEMIRPYIKERLDENIDKILQVDTILISSRHLYRAPYSLHEKSGLVSLPIEPKRVLEFKKDEAEPNKVHPKLSFLDKYEKDEAGELIETAYDWDHQRQLKKQTFENTSEANVKEYDEFDEKIPEEFFPNCIKQGLQGMKDGKKRFLFVLLNFLKCVNWNFDDIDKRIKEWNETNPEPLKEGYVISQLSWHKRNKEKILPPNYSNNAYYTDLGLDCKQDIERGIKNPVNYAIKMYRIAQKRNSKQ